MPAGAGSSKSKSHTCEDCGQVLSRQDHLERHRLTAHSERGAFDSACTACGRRFSRRDVLVRHYRVLHGIHCEPRPKGRPRKTSKQAPNKASASSADSETQTNADSSNSFPQESAASERSQIIPEPPSELPSQLAGDTLDSQWEMLLNATSSELHNVGVAPVSDRNSHNRSNFSNAFHQDSDLMTSFPGVQPLFDNGFYSFNDFDSNFSLLSWMNSETLANTYSMPPDLSVPDVPMQGLEDPNRSTRVQQMMRDSKAMNHNAIGANTDTGLSLDKGDSVATFPNIDTSALPTPSASHDPSAGTPLEEAPDPVSVERDANTWPYEYQAEGEEERIAFPVLNPEDLRSAQKYHSVSGTSSPRKNFQLLGTFGKLDDKKLSSIIQLLSLPLVRVPWQEDVDLLRSLPGPDILHHFTDLYFLHFHDLWPIIHRPTFKISDAPTILVLTMACIGACYSGLDRSIEFADTLAELCRRTSTWMGEHDPRFLRSPSYGVSLLLQHLHAMGSGSRRLFEMTDASRSRLISIARQMNSTGLHVSRSETESSERDTFQTWLDWVSKEQVKRLGWFLFEFDCLYSAFSKQNPCTKLEELPPEFPCEQLHWDAPTAFSWAACPFQTAPRGPPTMQTIHDFLEKPSPSIISSLDNIGKRLLIRCLGQQLYACQEQMDSGLYHILWKGNNGLEVSRAVRSQLSRAILSVYEFSWADHPRRYTLRHALRIGVAGHYSHIFGAGKIVDLVTRVARKRASVFDMTRLSNTTGSASNTNNKGAAVDEAATIAAFGEHPEIIREMMWHASQVCYLQRRHPFNSPLEPLSVFLAGITLWASCKYFCPHQASMRTGPSIQLDEPSFCSSQRASQAVKDWIKNGGKTFLEGVGDVQDPEAPSRVLQLSVDITRRLKVWQMASNVSEIFVRLLQIEEQEAAHRHETNTFQPQ
ncbi:hypothetical protein Z517_06047 [Fonsecaea pedrosoi CBS 271.37]|uniref:C2H2-type domain-containing protein n=1 Tax=Fonsecaea pedrosoi CBS 271.37 TaxID=1442368 RepID=A0A0D2GLS3_9EURO|nr:uncharacterized protein Z517_06047 [Fonsecaea pedrosoi CBS 271.37]KIW79435.1 hypothetical protein Z517_06047 [Fonsecaea pedrosoi CBS 271.37]